MYQACKRALRILLFPITALALFENEKIKNGGSGELCGLS